MPTVSPTTTQTLLKLIENAGIPQSDRIVLAVRLFWTMRREHFRQVFPHLAESTLRWYGVELMRKNLLGRERETRDSEYLYYLKPKGAALIEEYTGETDVPSIREQKSKQGLFHEDICTDLCLRMWQAHKRGAIELIAVERSLTKLIDTALVHDADGVEMTWDLKPDIYFLYRAGTKLKSYYWEIANKKSGRDRKTRRPALDVKAEAYHNYCMSGEFTARLRKSLNVEVTNTRVAFTFPTADRATRFTVEKLAKLIPHYLGRFWVGHEATYKADLLGKVFLCPKDYPETLHSLVD